MIRKTNIGFFVLAILLISLAFDVSKNPALAESFFDRCMRKYSPPPGPTYGFMAAQSACHAAMTRHKEKQRAALCVAGGSKNIQSPKQFDTLVSRCYGTQPVDREIKMNQCIFPNYMKVRSRAELDTLVQLCKR